MRKLLGLFLVLLLLSAPCFSAVKGVTSSAKDMLKIGTDAIVPKGAVVQSAVTIGGRANVAGIVQKDVVAIGGNLQLQKTAIVGGNAVSVGGKVIREQGAVVGGKVIEVAAEQLSSVTTLGFDKAFTKDLEKAAVVACAIYLIALLILALIVAALFPTHLGRASYYSERKAGPALLWGFLGLALILPIFVLLFVSLIGILFIPLFVLVLVAALFFGYVAFSQLFGKKILGILKIRNKPMWIELLVGFVILELITMIPFIGWLIKIIVCAIGFGAVIATKFGTTD